MFDRPPERCRIPDHLHLLQFHFRFRFRSLRQLTRCPVGLQCRERPMSKSYDTHEISAARPEDRLQKGHRRERSASCLLESSTQPTRNRNSKVKWCLIDGNSLERAQTACLNTLAFHRRPLRKEGRWMEKVSSRDGSRPYFIYTAIF